MSQNISCVSPDELWLFIAAEPLLSFFFLHSQVRESRDYEAVASVQVSGGQILLRLNPDSFAALTTRQRIGTLVHEYLHVLLQHCTSRMVHKIGSRARKENFAMDMAINQMVRRAWDLPARAIYHDLPQFGYPDGLSAEEYFYLLDAQYPDAEFDQQFGQMGFDSHDDWQPSAEDSALIQETARNYADSYGRADVGQTLAADSRTRGMLEQVLACQDNDLDWWAVVAAMVRSHVAGSRRSYRRPSRRFPFPAMGRVQARQVRVAAIVDTSASIDTSFLANIAGNINQLSALAEVDVLMCDTEVQSEGIVKRFKRSEQLTFSGRRATDLQPAFSLAEAERHRCVVCFTDGHFSKKIICSIPVVWVSINNPGFSPGFGRTVHVNWKEVRV